MEQFSFLSLSAQNITFEIYCPQEAKKNLAHTKDKRTLIDLKFEIFVYTGRQDTHKTR